MKYKAPIDAFAKAAQRHPFNDGIAEILVGLLLATAALVTLSKWGFLVLFVALGLSRLLPRLRDHVATPRAGAATLPRENPWRFLLGIFAYGLLVGGILIALHWLTADRGSPLGEYRWLPLFVGLWLSGGFLHAVRTTGLKRFGVYLAASLGGGAYFTLAMNTGARAAAYGELRNFLGFLAAMVLIGGIGTLINFLRRNPVFVPGEHAEAGHGH
ncbi:MAG: hypothetical protein JNL98_29175 [Bryobacterales bacterium]|nr:hypothetical protein [Bryobacterales bacterium]